MCWVVRCHLVTHRKKNTIFYNEEEREKLWWISGRNLAVSLNVGRCDSNMCPIHSPPQDPEYTKQTQYEVQLTPHSVTLSACVIAIPASLLRMIKKKSCNHFMAKIIENVSRFCHNLSNFLNFYLCIIYTFWPI